MRKPIKHLKIQLKGEVYSQLYDMQNIDLVIQLVNEMFTDEIKISIVNVEEE